MGLCVDGNRVEREEQINVARRFLFAQKREVMKYHPLNPARHVLYPVLALIPRSVFFPKLSNVTTDGTFLGQAEQLSVPLLPLSLSLHHINCMNIITMTS